MGPEVTPFRIEIPEAQLEDLRDRLDRTRWPERETVSDWSQGISLAYIQELCQYWRERYDWRRTEARLNEIPQFGTAIDGLGIHFMHVRSAHPGAFPLLLTHGWPESVAEFLKVIEPLADPRAHGDWESFGARELPVISAPTGCSIFPKEIFRLPRRAAERQFSDLRHWHELDRGGHFAALEQPAVLIDERPRPSRLRCEDR